MTRWKLSRQAYGNEEYKIVEGDEVTVGRGINNTIILASIVVSRNHCVINAQREKVYITDLKSSNGVYVGTKKIPQNTPYILKESDIIGFGWTSGAPVVNISNNEKFMFKLVKERLQIHSLQFQSDSETNEINDRNTPPPVIKTEHEPIQRNSISPVINIKPELKRKLSASPKNDKIKKEVLEKKSYSRIVVYDDDIINITSDSNNEEEDTAIKKPKLMPFGGEVQKEMNKEEPVKTEKEDFEYDAFNVKQEYLGYNDEPIQIGSDSDSECEQWMIRLSQSSPGKPFTKAVRESKIDINHEESSYSQLDDFINDEDFVDDLITIPPVPPEVPSVTPLDEKINNELSSDDQLLDDLISFHIPTDVDVPAQSSKTVEKSRDEVDGSSRIAKVPNTSEVPVSETPIEITNKRAQMIDPLVQSNRKKPSNHTIHDYRHKSSSYRHGKDHKQSSKRHGISNSQKEERKKKLKEIATREKEESEQRIPSNSSSKQDKSLVKAKVTTSNRGAFLTDVVQGVVKPMKRKESPQTSARNKDKHELPSVKDVPKVNVPEPVEEAEKKKKHSSKHSKIKIPELDEDGNKKKQSQKDTPKLTVLEPVENIENRKKQSEKPRSEEHKKSKHKNKHEDDKSKSSTQTKSHNLSGVTKSRVPLKSLKPLSETEKDASGRPISKVEPFSPKKQEKKVRFSDAGPSVHVFEIEEGNEMKKTSLVKTTLVDKRQKPVFTLEKITLTKVLGWNPQWLEEQINQTEPPPILGHNNPPMTIFHSFDNHNQYVQLVGDLLLMEIWECLTQGYMRKRGQTGKLEMRVECLPPPPVQERYFELFNLSVNLSVPNSELRTVPRMGEVMIIEFGPVNARNRRFFYVHNVRCLPSPPKNIYSFFSISLHVCYTEKMRSLRPGETVVGHTLAYINKEITLFEAMEYLAGSPLNEAILRPHQRHFLNSNAPLQNAKSEWTKTLNPSQQLAVNSSVSAALGDQPCIQMVQGPPGTGKSGVICAIVMTYFYNSSGTKRQQNRGKILICATSNAAVDELVIRLLNIRQTLPKGERFRMVRVGRAEAMHPRAHEVCSQELAKRDAARAHAAEPAHHGLSEEIRHLEAKINMWKTQAQDAKDPVRVAYCQGRVSDLARKITLLRGGGGGGGGGEVGKEVRGEELVHAERRIIELADIVVTTLASAYNHKMRVLKRRIALCIVDEAGQAIEPETLIPLTLDVTRLTLIGDPQQLPGFICSQRAKKHGLGESLFSRLTSCAEHWPSSPVVLLNEQYRMHPDIADYPNRAFYGGRILTAPKSRPELAIPPYSIVGISSGDVGQEMFLELPPHLKAKEYWDRLSGANEIEAWGVARLVLALSGMVRARNLSLAVITPYNAHKELIKKNLKLLQDSAEAHVEVNTVDSFQGQERDVVVVSLARSQGVGFLTDAGRMNVMLTRARQALLVCLNPHAVLRNHQWRTLVEDAQRRKMYRVLPNKVCQPVSAAIPSEEVLQYVTYQSRNCK